MKHLCLCLVIPFFLLPMAFSSCKKEKPQIVKNEKYAGDYDFMYSIDYSYTTIPSDNHYADYRTLGHYGIRIKKNGKVFVFREGKLENKSKLELKEAYQDELYINIEGKAYKIGFNGEKLISDYPFPGKQNVFTKIK